MKFTVFWVLPYTKALAFFNQEIQGTICLQVSNILNSVLSWCIKQVSKTIDYYIVDLLQGVNL